MEGVLSRNQNYWDRKVQLARGQWRHLPQLRFCRLRVLKEKWEELELQGCIKCGLLFSSALLLSLGALLSLLLFWFY